MLNPNVEGIYETKTPLKFRAINELGCLIKPKKSKIPRHEQALGRIYSLDELEVLTGHNSPYLPSGSYERLYLLHSYTGQRHVFTYFCFPLKQIVMGCVLPTGKEKVESLGTSEVQSMKTTMLSQLQELELDEEAEFVDWEIVRYFTTTSLKNCLGEFDKLFAEYRAKNKVSTLVLLQSVKSPDQLANLGLKNMVKEFPIICVDVDPSDNKFAALGWQQQAFRQMVQRFTEIGQWLLNRITLARYSLLPICNLGG